ncbi:hypothetical protein [Desulfosporosinus sp. SB140]|uniref:hypothetical protein n=1 Tax=Desulfosporosinus paludis TaxID=3115649 RepID=UPI00389048AA
MADTGFLINFIVNEATKDDVQSLVRMRLLLQQHMEVVNPQILKHNKKRENDLPNFYADLIDDPKSLVLVALDNNNGRNAMFRIEWLLELLASVFIEEQNCFLMNRRDFRKTC